jgi:CheY-like chemotaxis protein
LHKSGPMGKLRVLIVEDNSDVRRLYAIGLNQHGFEVKLAANGAEAVERIQEEQPDVIVLDWLMPLMDGGEVLSRVSTNGIPIIVISGQPALADDARDPRIVTWLTKPVTIEELVEQIERPAAVR